MKLFFRFLPMVVLTILLAIPFAFSVSAEDTPVLFVMDGGTGDGSSADNPLSTVDYYINEKAVSVSYQYLSPLYQAAHRLQYSGGTIVICGEIMIDDNKVQGNNFVFEDFIMPAHPDAVITFTSVWDGVDYRKTNGARLIFKGSATFASGGPTIFRDIDICTVGTDRLIAANCYNLTMDSGVACIPLNSDGTAMASPSASHYPHISGGNRYQNLARRDGDFTVTIQSGTYNNIDAGTFGINNNAYGNLQGNPHIVIGGSTTVMGSVYGTTHRATPLLSGDSSITINGGTIHGNIYATGGSGFGFAHSAFRLTIRGGTIHSSEILGKAKKLEANTETRIRYNPALSVLDLSDCSAALAISLASKAANFTQIILPAVRSGKVSDVTLPVKTQYFIGETYDPGGLRFTLTANGVASVIDYTPDNANFQFLPAIDQPLTVGNRSIDIYYGSTYVGRSRITVSDAPSLDIMGAQIKTDSEKQTLRFVGRLGGDVSGVTVTEYGFVIQPTEFFSEKSVGMPGATLINATGTSLTEQGGFRYFAGDVTDIPVEEYDIAFTAFAFMKLTYGGKEYTVYSDTIERSVRGVAEAACADNSREPSAKKAKLSENVLSATVSTPDKALIDSKIDKLLSNMKAMGSVKWVCNADMDFKDETQFTQNLQYTKGVTYTGIPYVAGNNGEVNLSQWLSICPDGGTYNGPNGWHTMFGSQCSTAVMRALQTVTNEHNYPAGYSIQYSLPKDTQPYYKAVGGYSVHPCTQMTQEIVQQQGSTNAERLENVYEAYTHAKKGDFMVSTWESPNGHILGHIRIVDSVHVVYKNGEIDSEKSYMLLTEQQATMNKKTFTTWKFKAKYLFKNLCNFTTASHKYIPIRLKGFESGYFATPYMTVRERNTPDNIANGLSGKIYSNYQIHEIRVTITDSAGKEVIMLETYPFTTLFYDLRRLDLNNTVAKLPAGRYHYELEVAYAEEKNTCVSFDFTK